MAGDEAKQNTVTWLHLSDLHLCNPKNGWDARQILKKLQEDFRRLQEEERLKPDLIFFTGDAAFGHLGKERGSIFSCQFPNGMLGRVKLSWHLFPTYHGRQ